MPNIKVLGHFLLSRPLLLLLFFWQNHVSLLFLNKPQNVLQKCKYTEKRVCRTLNWNANRATYQTSTEWFKLA